MIKRPHNAFGFLTKLFKVISPGPLRHAEGHDEWLLDEALAETFPASDSIAVTPIHLLRGSSSRKPREIKWPSKVSDCDIGHGKEPDSKAMETSIECDNCHTKIPATVALSLEGADYIYHFCGQQCLDAWCKATNAHDE